uniref:Zinc metalloproteinase n=1 Tax=Parascaris univalens TaxID=6257 RepID=A0A915AT68_PARUN
MLLAIMTAVIASCANAEFKIAHNSGDASDYAEVRAILNEYFKVAARKHGAYSDYNPLYVNSALQSTSFDDGTEASTNRRNGVAGDLFENDILLTLPQARALLKEVRRRGSRQAQVGLQYFWPRKPISFIFAAFENDWQNLIRNALRYMERETCIRFQENGNAVDHIQFIRGAGCWSSVGRIGGRQQISIGYGCEGVGIIVHETLHALGLWHEQSRDDRDEYILINYENIYPGTQGNFEKRSSQTTDNMGEPYDLGSVMHYGSKAFAVDYARNTIRTRDRNFQQTIGQRSQMSFKDIKMINRRYCSDICSRQLRCQNGGYTDPNKCNQCKCPQGYGGIYCNHIQESAPVSCGGNLQATEHFNVLQSPSLHSNMHCVWRITSPGRVLVVIDQLSFPCSETCSSYLELKSRNEKTATGPRFCCGLPEHSLLSEGNDFIAILNTPSNADPRYPGFRIRYKSYGSTAGSTSTLLTTIAPTIASTLGSSTSTTDRLSGMWSEWAGWSGCTMSCGGCGIRRRIRACYSRDRRCSGSATMEEACGLQPCPSSVDRRPCAGQLLLPCDLMEKLNFGGRLDSTTAFRTASFPQMELGRNKRQRIRNYEKSRQQTTLSKSSEALCEKKFTFYCPTSLLTISLQWKQPGETTHDTRGCCQGYHISEGICKKIK